MKARKKRKEAQRSRREVEGLGFSLWAAPSLCAVSYLKAEQSTHRGTRCGDQPKLIIKLRGAYAEPSDYILSTGSR